MGVPTWMISEELLGETPHLKFENAKWLCLKMRHPFDLLVNHDYPCYSMLKPPFFCGEIHHFYPFFRHTQSCCHDWLAPFIGDDAHGDPSHGSMVGRTVTVCQGGSVCLGLWQLSQFQGTTQASGVENGGKVALTKKKSRAVWKVLLMVGESSNVPVSWCWGVACLITWGNINTVQFGSVLNVRCLKKNRQGAGVPPKSTRCWHPRAWPKPVTTADSLNMFKHTLTHTRKCLGVCPCVYYNYIY